MKGIKGQKQSVRELLDKKRYTIDVYQREYSWKERQIRELIDDLSGKFLEFYDSDHARHQVEGYGHYFLGSIVLSRKDEKQFIVDGQQRLTSLTLLLIYLRHLQSDRDDVADITTFIYSDRYGEKKFNLDVPDRSDVMRQLLDGIGVDVEGQTESVCNIVQQYQNIADCFPEEVSGDALPYFVDWMLENVSFVEIVANSPEDAYTIFETMNDRGLSLSLPEMLKGYVLANILQEEKQKEVNRSWKHWSLAFKSVGDGEDVVFFKNWLRAQYAETIRSSKKGSVNEDYERIGSEFHRWVRENKDQIGLTDRDSFVRFVKRDLEFFGKHALAIRKASVKMIDGWESVYFNESRKFTHQHQILLAALNPDDSADIVHKKVSLVADYLDIWLARRVWNFRTTAYSSVRYTMFMLTKELRGLGVVELSGLLRRKLDEQAEVFAGESELRLHKQNYWQIRHVLARMTHWVDAQCGLVSHFEGFVSKGQSKPFEIEHLWANKYERFTDAYAHPSEFEVERNRLGEASCGCGGAFGHAQRDNAEYRSLAFGAQAWGAVELYYIAGCGTGRALFSQDRSVEKQGDV